MPIYAFQCADCGHSFDRLQKMSDPIPAACPACGAGGVRRQVTAPSFRLSGSGWYETDFKKAGEARRNLVDRGGDTPAAAKEGGGDAKPAAAPAKTESKPAASKPTAGST